ncbi:MAG: tRNA preQ1(34) S-adenosylmethionine ribosyltransferase-isomerase QueA [Spirochaetaceae bacterium]|nr:MAG: tRNA preQ1(34) S-adenosylmethionine ribosyltransferase-isomerase QueA [Spirochaetaceae bacterium]
MTRTDFSFELPEELIAQHPSEQRGQSRLLVMNRQAGTLAHERVDTLPMLLPQLFPDGVVMVFNTSRVRKARLYGASSDGTRREFLLLSPITDAEGASRWSALTRTRRLRSGSSYAFEGGVSAVVESVDHGIAILRFDRTIGEAYFDAHGHVPLPPYIDRADAPDDEERYQTVYAREPGSVAAPTAGLHFTDSILERLGKVADFEWVKLHVGIGTFLPVRVDRIEAHTMHAEECEIDADTADRLNRARAGGKRILAVGTTTVRTLETAWNRDKDRLEAFRGATDLFITPGYHYGAVDGLFTNFHTPESTLLMLVCAFAGTDAVLSAYRVAVAARYRFFSYGDAMLIV